MEINLKREQDVCYHNLSVIDGKVLLLLVEAGKVDCFDIVNVDQVWNWGRLIEELVEHDLRLGDRSAWTTIPTMILSDFFW